LIYKAPKSQKESGRIVTNSTSWDYQACTNDTLWRQRYITTSKKYL